MSQGGYINSITTILTTKGDLVTHDTIETRLPVGTDGQVLSADSSEATGLKWTDASAGSGDVTASSNLTDNSIIRGDGGAKGVQDSAVIIDDSDNITGVLTLGIAGDLTNYEATNDGSPQIRMGSSDAEEVHIQTVYDAGAQTLDHVLLQTDAESGTANKGLFRFNVDGSDICDIDDGGIDLDTGGALSIAGTDVLDATTLGTNVVASSLTSVGTITTGVWTGTDVVAASGGTGRSSHTAYAVICGGTTTTAAQQSIASVGTAALVLTSNGPGALPTFQAAVMPSKEYWFSGESLQPLETAFAPLVKLSGSTVITFVRAFDDTTEEYASGKLQVPGNVDTSGTVTFRVYCMAATAAASKNIALTFGHVAVNNSEDFDVAYTDEDSGDVVIDATQDDVTEATWTETVSNLAWAANDLIFFRLSRDPAATNDLTGDLYVFSLAVEIPRA